MALGGPMIFLSSFHLSAAFRTPTSLLLGLQNSRGLMVVHAAAHAGTVLAMITGAFDASSIPYLIYKVIYQAGHRAPLRAFFWVYLVIPALQVARALRSSDPADPFL